MFLLLQTGVNRWLRCRIIEEQLWFLLWRESARYGKHVQYIKCDFAVFIFDREVAKSGSYKLLSCCWGSSVNFQILSNIYKSYGKVEKEMEKMWEKMENYWNKLKKLWKGIKKIARKQLKKSWGKIGKNWIKINKNWEKVKIWKKKIKI